MALAAQSDRLVEYFVAVGAGKDLEPLEIVPGASLALSAFVLCHCVFVCANPCRFPWFSTRFCCTPLSGTL